MPPRTPRGDALASRVPAPGSHVRLPQAAVDLLAGTHAGNIDAHAVQPHYTKLLAEASGLAVTLAMDGEAAVIAAA